MTNLSQPMTRLLKSLARSTRGGTIRPDDRLDVAYQAGSVLRRAVFPREVWQGALNDDVVVRAGEVIMLSPAGRARLARQGKEFLSQHAALSAAVIEGPAGRESVTINEAESPLAWLRRRGGAAYIDDCSFAAGERLRADFTRGMMEPRVTASWSQSVATQRRGESGFEYSDLAIAARQRVRAAIAAVGPELGGLLLDVCCFLKGLETVERDRHWPPRSAKVALSLALRQLARHYGIVAEARGPDRAPLRMWGAEDYRPDIAAR